MYATSSSDTTSGGRPRTLLLQFIEMALYPVNGVAGVLRDDPSLVRIAWSLALIGLLRGIVEGFWYYLMTGQFDRLHTLVGRAEWYTRLAGPFLLLNIPSAHFLWFVTAIILYLSGRLLGGRGHFRQILQVSGVALFSYLPIGLLNYLHLIWPLPSITLRASDFYQPNLGIGQLLVFAWLIFVAYAVQRRIQGLSPLSAALAAPLPVLLSLMLYLASAGIFFRLIPHVPGAKEPHNWLSLANSAYLIATIMLTGAMFWCTRHLIKAGDGR